MLLQQLLEVPDRMTGGVLCHRFRGANNHDLASLPLGDGNGCLRANRVVAQVYRGISVCLEPITTIIQGKEGPSKSFYGECRCVISKEGCVGKKGSNGTFSEGTCFPSASNQVISVESKSNTDFLTYCE